MCCGRLTPDLNCIYQTLQDLSLPTAYHQSTHSSLVSLVELVFVGEGCRVAACLLACFGIGCLKFQTTRPEAQGTSQGGSKVQVQEGDTSNQMVLFYASYSRGFLDRPA